MQDVLAQMQQRRDDDAQCDKKPLEYDHQREDKVIEAGVNYKEHRLSSGHDKSVTSMRQTAWLVSSRCPSIIVPQVASIRVHPPCI